jgi:hypothetical protein
MEGNRTLRAGRFGFGEVAVDRHPTPRASRMPLLTCRDCGVLGPVTLYRDGSSREAVSLCDECRGAITLDAFACGEEDSLAPVFK